MRAEVRQASMALMDALTPKPGEEYTLRSRSKDGHEYRMIVTPDGYAVHQGLGCEGEMFSGVLGCWHAKTRTPTEEEMTQALTTYKPNVPERIDFTDEQIKTITDVIAVDYQGNRAPPAFVQLFLAACRHTGLDPFLRQIYPLNLKGKWTMYVGIDGYRVISERTGLDQGMDGPQWSDDGETWYDYPSEEPARYCRVGIWRKGVPRAFVATLSMSSKMNPASDSWQKDPNGMLAKCCEALARRRAFPADMSVLPNDVQFSVEDADGAPLTRAEVPEGSFREIDAPTSVQAPPAPPRPAPEPRPEPEPVEAIYRESDDITVAYMDLVKERGKDAGLAALAWAIETFPGVTDTKGKLVKSKLEPDQAKDFISEIRRYAKTGVARCADDEHEAQYSEDTTLLECSVCGLGMQEPELASPEPVAAGLGI